MYREDGQCCFGLHVKEGRVGQDNMQVTGLGGMNEVWIVQARSALPIKFDCWF